MGVEVLLVEDDEGDALLVARALEDIAIISRVTVKRDGETALRHLEANARHPDLILLDLHLPGMNGFDVLKALKANPSLQVTPVIVFSGSQDHADILHAYQLQASAFVSKPDNVQEYGNAVRAVCDFWLGIAQLPEE